MPVSGWKYMKMGQCSDCSEAGARLFAPVLEGHPSESFPDLVNGEHIPHFDPVCKRCTKLYVLAMICGEHKLPVRVTGQCKRCLPKDPDLRTGRR